MSNANVLNPTLGTYASPFYALAGKPQFEKMIIVSQPRYYNPVSRLVSMSGQSIQKGGQIVNIESLGNTWITANITTRTASGSQLILIWDDPTFEKLIVGTTLQASNGAYGQVMTASPGQVTIRCVYSSTGTQVFQTADFAAATVVTDRGDMSTNSGARARSTILYAPTNRFNYISTVRDTAFVTSLDMSLEYLVQWGNTDKVYTKAEAMMLQRLAKQIEIKTFGDPRVQMSATEYYAGGFRWQIINEGGYYQPLSADVTELDLQNMLETLKMNGGGTGSHYMVLAGTKWCSSFDRFMKPYITYAGVNNTFGLLAKGGIDFTFYKFAGKSIAVVDWELFSDPQMFPVISTITGGLKQASAALFLDVSPSQTVGGGTLPWLQSYHFGQKAMYGMIKGMVDQNNQGGTEGNYMVQGSDVSGIQFDVEYRLCNVLTNPIACGLQELTS